MREILAYIAGIVDGEGSICICRNSKTGYYYPKVYVGMTDKVVIDFLQTIFPSQTYSAKLPSGRIIWKWHTTHSNTVSFLEAIYEFLRAKKKQADVIFEFYSKRGFRGSGRKLTQKEIKRRKQLYEKLKRLHKK